MQLKTEKDFWDSTKELLGAYHVEFGKRWQNDFQKDPKKLAFHFSRAKFASKIACQGKSVLELGCEEGMGAVLLGELASSYLGIDLNSDAINAAKQNHPHGRYQFLSEEFLGKKYGSYQVVVSFDFFKHLRKGKDLFFSTILQNLSDDGIFILGCPSVISKEESLTLGISSESLQKELRLKLSSYFHQVFPFGMQDEIVHTSPQANYYLFLSCHKKDSYGPQ